MSRIRLSCMQACMQATFEVMTLLDRGATPATDRLSAAEHAYQSVKSAIIRGDLAGGAAISENTVRHNLGVSRTPVHEAFLRLAAEELITLESRRGAVVRPIAPSEALHVLEMREAIESAAAKRLIADGNGDSVAGDLGELLGIQQEALRDGDVDTFVEADDRFHTAIVAGAHNPVALHFTRLLRDRQQRLRHQLMRVRPDQLSPAYEQHCMLSAALESADPARYDAVLREHIAMHKGVL